MLFYFQTCLTMVAMGICYLVGTHDERRFPNVVSRSKETPKSSSPIEWQQTTRTQLFYIKNHVQCLSKWSGAYSWYCFGEIKWLSQVLTCNRVPPSFGIRTQTKFGLKVGPMLNRPSYYIHWGHELHECSRVPKVDEDLQFIWYFNFAHMIQMHDNSLEILGNVSKID